MMKLHILAILALLIPVVYGCGKYDLEEPDFDVVADKTTVRVGDSIQFSFTGNPQLLYFYSGQFLNRYAPEESKQPGDLLLTFTSARSGGSQNNQVDLLISNDFNGVYNINNIMAAKWDTLSSQVTWGTGSTRTPSGDINLLGRVDVKKQLYIAFRYITRDQNQYGTARNISIYDILLKSNVDGTPVTLFTFSTPQFGMFSYGNKESERSVVATGINFRGNATTELRTEYTEDWAVSGAITTDPNVAAVDRAISLKLFTESKKTNYLFAWSAPGQYRAAFVAETSNVYGRKKQVKFIDITVNP
jgi:hypothetical protein